MMPDIVPCLVTQHGYMTYLLKYTSERSPYLLARLFTPYSFQMQCTQDADLARIVALYVLNAYYIRFCIS